MLAGGNAKDSGRRNKNLTLVTFPEKSSPPTTTLNSKKAYLNNNSNNEGYQQPHPAPNYNNNNNNTFDTHSYPQNSSKDILRRWVTMEQLAYPHNLKNQPHVVELFTRQVRRCPEPPEKELGYHAGGLLWW